MGLSADAIVVSIKTNTNVRADEIPTQRFRAMLAIRLSPWRSAWACYRLGDKNGNGAPWGAPEMDIEEQEIPF